MWDPSYKFADSFPENPCAHTLFRLPYRTRYQQVIPLKTGNLSTRGSTASLEVILEKLYAIREQNQSSVD